MVECAKIFACFAVWTLSLLHPFIKESAARSAVADAADAPRFAGAGAVLRARPEVDFAGQADFSPRVTRVTKTIDENTP